MADQGRWFKLWCEAIDDPDLGNLELEDFARWCIFGVYLKKHGTGGTIVLNQPCKILQQKFRVPSFEGVISVLQKFPNCTVTGVTTATVTWRNWLKYQGDFSNDRVAKFRQLKRAKRRGEEKRREETRKEENRLPPIPSFGPREFVALWNESAERQKLPACLDWTERADKIRLRLKKHPGREFWEGIHGAIAQSPFLLGDSESGWHISIDWLIKNDTNAAKIAEGAYANRKESAGQKTARNLGLV